MDINHINHNHHHHTPTNTNTNVHNSTFLNWEKGLSINMENNQQQHHDHDHDLQHQNYLNVNPLLDPVWHTYHNNLIPTSNQSSPPFIIPPVKYGSEPHPSVSSNTMIKSSLLQQQILLGEDNHEELAEEEEEEELGAMKEMMYRIAVMQPVDIDPATIRKPKRRNVRISNDPQSVAARHRRERISERIRILQRLVPGGVKMDTASMLDEAISYVKFLKRQVRQLQPGSSNYHLPSVPDIPPSDWPPPPPPRGSHP